MVFWTIYYFITVLNKLNRKNKISFILKNKLLISNCDELLHTQINDAK